jgi:hypothetical protein
MALLRIHLSFLPLATLALVLPSLSSAAQVVPALTQSSDHDESPATLSEQLTVTPTRASDNDMILGFTPSYSFRGYPDCTCAGGDDFDATVVACNKHETALTTYPVRASSSGMRPFSQPYVVTNEHSVTTFD